jgi:hypothetical protein
MEAGGQFIGAPQQFVAKGLDPSQIRGLPDALGFSVTGDMDPGRIGIPRKVSERLAPIGRLKSVLLLMQIRRKEGKTLMFEREQAAVALMDSTLADHQYYVAAQ